MCARCAGERLSRVKGFKLRRGEGKEGEDAEREREKAEKTVDWGNGRRARSAIPVVDRSLVGWGSEDGNSSKRLTEWVAVPQHRPGRTWLGSRGWRLDGGWIVDWVWDAVRRHGPRESRCVKA